MTGQGDKNYEQIKKGKAARSAAALDVSKTFRTANGLAVRNLRVEKTNQVVINGKVITTAYQRFIVTGEVYTQEKWLPSIWDANGVHPQVQFNLVEHKQAATQGSFF